MGRRDCHLQVDGTERDELVARAARERVDLFDYIRAGSACASRDRKGDADLASTRYTRQQIADHELRLQALEGERA